MPHYDSLTATVTGVRTQITSELSAAAIVLAEQKITSIEITPVKTPEGNNHVRFGTIAVTSLYGKTCLEGVSTTIRLEPHSEVFSNLYLAPINGSAEVDVQVTFI